MWRMTLKLISLGACLALGSANTEAVGWMMPKEFEKLPGAYPAPQETAAVPAAEAPAAEEVHPAAPAAAEELESRSPTEVGKVHEASEVEKEVEELKHEEEEEEEPDAVTWTTALLLIGFLIIVIGLLYLVNCADEDIREAIWGMINTTVSIFCAATFDNAVFRFFHFQVILSPPPRGFGLKHDTPEIKSIVGLVFAMGASAFFHVALFLVPSDSHQLLYSIRTIGGHVYAFASILCFGFLQETSYFRENIWTVLLVVALAVVVMVLSYKIVMTIAKPILEARGHTWKDSQVQRAQMKEMQTDASAITVGFLLAQAFCYAMSQAEETEKKFIPILHGYPSEFVEHCTWILTGTATALLIFSAIWSIYLRPKKGTKLCGCLGNFVFDYIGVLASVTGCWCLQRAGMIFLFHRFAGSAEQLGEGMATNRANIVNAFLMSLVSVICVLVIDKLADRFEKTEENKTQTARVMTQSPREEESAFSLSSIPALPVDLSLGDMVGDDELDKLSAGLRTVMTGFGMLVGICWDKAFETAHETVAETVPIFHDHPVIGTGLVAALLLFFVIPAWYWYIVPNAMKDEDEHKQDIIFQKSLMAQTKGPQLEVEASTSDDLESFSE